MSNFIGLTIKNLGIIEAAYLDFNGKHLVQLRGRNRAGKSTAVNAIRYLFSGGKEIPPGAVAQGKAKAEIIGYFEGWEAKRIVKPDGSASLEVKKDGVKQPSPQTFIDTLAGRLPNITRLAEMSGAELKETLMDYLNIDFTEIDATIEEAKQERLLIGRDIKSLGTVTPVAKVEFVNTKELFEQRKQIELFNKAQDEKRQAIEQAVRKLREGLTDYIERGDFTIEQLKADLSSANALYKEKMPEIERLPKPEEKQSTEELDKHIQEADELNVKAGAYQTYMEKQAKLETLEKQYADYTAQIDNLKEKKQSMLQDAGIPVPGLELTADGIAFNGILNDNISISERYSIAVKVAATFSGELNVMFMERGESLDSANLRRLAEYAEANELLIITEIVDDSYTLKGNGVFYIEEGKITEQGGEQ